MILIEAKENSPYILLEPSENYMIVKGNSFMTNPSQFYSAINNWISTYTVPTGEQFRIELTMGYYNTTSIQIINLLFKTLHKNNPHKIKLKIFIDKEEEDLIECAGSLTFNTGLVPQIELF